MKNLLRKGQVFRCKKFKDLKYNYEYDAEAKKSFVNINSLRFCQGDKITVYGTETKDGGWKREIITTIDLSIPDNDLNKRDFIVLDVEISGGGTGHGQYDVFPDGHHITAKEVGGDRRVVFYQTGCFVGMVDPKDVELISGPADEYVRLKITYEEDK